MYFKFDDYSIEIEGGDTFCVIFEGGPFFTKICIEMFLDRQP